MELLDGSSVIEPLKRDESAVGFGFFCVLHLQSVVRTIEAKACLRRTNRPRLTLTAFDW